MLKTSKITLKQMIFVIDRKTFVESAKNSPSTIRTVHNTTAGSFQKIKSKQSLLSQISQLPLNNQALTHIKAYNNFLHRNQHFYKNTILFLLKM
jgi:hypothetical protein